MAKVQRFTETLITLPAMGGFGQLCSQSYHRKILIIGNVPTPVNISITTVPSSVAADAANRMLLTQTSSGSPRWELTEATHGLLVYQPWYAASSGGPGGAKLVVIEVFEEETGSETRFSNDRPAFGTASDVPAAVMEADRAQRLIDALAAVQRGLRDASKAY